MQNSEVASTGSPESTYRFAWTCSFMGVVEYEVLGDGPSYRVEERRVAGDYERSIFNGTQEEWERDHVATIGLLRRRYDIEKPLNPKVVVAFNDWRAREHAKFVHELRSQPDRYGVFRDDDQLLVAPRVLRGAHYEVGRGWVVDPVET